MPQAARRTDMLRVMLPDTRLRAARRTFAARELAAAHGDERNAMPLSPDAAFSPLPLPSRRFSLPCCCCHDAFDAFRCR